MASRTSQHNKVNVQYIVGNIKFRIYGFAKCTYSATSQSKFSEFIYNVEAWFATIKVTTIKVNKFKRK